MSIYNEQFASVMQHGSVIVFFLNLFLHVVFSSFVAKDINNISKLGAAPQLFSSWVWVLAVLLGGFFMAVIYWVMHHSTLSRK